MFWVYKPSDVSMLHCFFTCFIYHFFCYILLDRTFVTPRLAWTYPILGKEGSLPMSDDKSSSQCRFKASSPHVPTKHIKLLSADEKITKGQSFDSSASVGQVSPRARYLLMEHNFSGLLKLSCVFRQNLLLFSDPKSVKTCCLIPGSSGKSTGQV